MKDLGIMTKIASGGQACPAPVIHAAGVLRCLERQQGTGLMLSSVLAALGYGAAATGRGAFMVVCFQRAAEGLAEDIADMEREGVLPPAAADGFEIDPDTMARLFANGCPPGLSELIIQARSAYDAMTTEQRAAHDEAQRQAWANAPRWGDEGTRVVDLSAFRKGGHHG